jgi:hypothetical protein
VTAAGGGGGGAGSVPKKKWCQPMGATQEGRMLGLMRAYNHKNGGSFYITW